MPTLDLDLFRSVRKDDFNQGVMASDTEPAATILHGDIEPRRVTLPTGATQIRQDWRTFTDKTFKTGHGTSLWDKRGVFGTKHWHYFTLPKGTVIPDSLKVVKGSFNEKYQATHYQIEVANGGELQAEALRGALDNFARNCVVRARELASA